MHAYSNYKKTLLACYLGFITQAIAANYTPLLFLTFKSTYAISFQIGCIGLMKAIDNFDTTLNVKFRTYAIPMIIS